MTVWCQDSGGVQNSPVLGTVSSVVVISTTLKLLIGSVGLCTSRRWLCLVGGLRMASGDFDHRAERYLGGVYSSADEKASKTCNKISKLKETLQTSYPDRADAGYQLFE